jgi:hypothetical protein
MSKGQKQTKGTKRKWNRIHMPMQKPVDHGFRSDTGFWIRNVYQCEKCEERFSSLKTLKSHLREVHAY